MKNIKKLLIVSIYCVLIGCGAQIKKISSTASGKPEVVISADVQLIKNELISRLVNYGYGIESDSPNSMIFSRSTDEAWVRLLAGNAYSNNERVMSYTFVRVDSRVRVICSPSIRARMLGGKINSFEIHDMNNMYNLFQEQLNAIKSVLESK